ncbi:unnamed protein product [Linum tenue]|uniref:Uncharacterized protein n=1 Tax=Linum tenue TaxID=586396 RepID=A0AAV0QCC3_9ROSI|nr:unnamed protein product [Linum tenue]
MDDFLSKTWICVQVNEFHRLRELEDFSGCRDKFSKRFKPRLTYMICHLEELQHVDRNLSKDPYKFKSV